VRIDLPVHFYLPEEYIAAADERVLAYRRIAAVQSADAAAELAAGLERDYGGLPMPALNLINRAKAKVMAAELAVTSVHVERGKLVLEGGVLSSRQAAWVKQHGGLYFAKSHRLQWPLAQAGDVFASLLGLLDGLQAIGTD
jgi:transcription-repair coupling factor (superfamily II helicase)